MRVCNDELNSIECADSYMCVCVCVRVSCVVASWIQLSVRTFNDICVRVCVSSGKLDSMMCAGS